MFTKVTSKNQITIPKTVMKSFKGTEYFEVKQENGKIILTPINPSRANEVREKLSHMGISERDIKDAIQWARK